MTTQAPKNTPKTGEKTRLTRAGSASVNEARAAAQRVKLDAQAEAREQEKVTAAALKKGVQQEGAGQAAGDPPRRHHHRTGHRRLPA
jgi:hypothetical protein